MDSGDDTRPPVLAERLRQVAESMSGFQDIVSALAFAVEAKTEANGVASELLRREGHHFGKIAFTRNETMTSLAESTLAFKDWIAKRVGNGPEAEQVATLFDRVIVAAMKAYYDMAMQNIQSAEVPHRTATRERSPSAMSSDPKSSAADDRSNNTSPPSHSEERGDEESHLPSPEMGESSGVLRSLRSLRTAVLRNQQTATNPKPDVSPDHKRSPLSALEGQILREVERYGKLLVQTGADADAERALSSLVEKGYVVPSVGIGIGLQVTETGRYVANLGQLR